MKALLCHEFSDLNSLKIEDTETRELQAGEVLVGVVACGLNFPDWLILHKKYQFTPELPYTPGGEVSGKVLEVGPEVSDFKVSDRVFAIERWGGLSEQFVLPAARLFKIPDDISFVDAATMMYNLSTAYYALKNRGKAKENEWILILDASGGVGLAAVQLAKTFGLKVIAAASNSEKLEFCRKYGADYGVGYGNLKENALEISGGRGVNLVLDTIGGENALEAVRTMAWGGRYLVVGFASGEIPKMPLNQVLLKGIDVCGVFWGKFSREEPLKQAENLQEIFKLISDKKVKPYIINSYNFVEAKLALKELGDRNTPGKSVVIVNPKLIEEEILGSKAQSKYIFKDRETLLKAKNLFLGESPWLLVSQELINNFADATHDHQWIHINKEKAADTKFGGTIAHGFLTLSLSPKFLEEIYEISFMKAGINYGVDKLRFIAPIKVGSQIKMTATMVETKESLNNGIRLKIRADYYVKGNSRVVCSAELLSVVY